MARNAYVAFFYYLNIISASKPIYFYIFWKVWLNVIFESWNQLKSYYGLNLKNVWMQQSFCLVIFTRGDLEIQMTWIQRAWIQHSHIFPTKLVSFNLVYWIDLGWFLKLGTEVCLNLKRKGLIWNVGLRGKCYWAGLLSAVLPRAA